MSVGKSGVVFVLLVAVLTAFTCVLATEKSTKSSSTQTDTITSKMFDFTCITRMNSTDLLRVGAMIVGFLAILFWDKRPSTFANAEMIIYGFFGFHAYFAPASVLGFAAVGATGVFHEYMLQVVGAFYLSACVLRYQASTDSSARFNRGLLSVLECVALLMVVGHAHMKYANDSLHLSSQHGVVSVLGLSLLCLGHLLHLVRQGFGDGGRSSVVMKSVLNQHLLVDGFLMVLFGVLYFGFPDLAISQIILKDFKPDGIVASIVRYIGIGELFIGLSSILALGSSNEGEKRAILTHRLVYLGLYTPLMFLYQWKHEFVSFADFVTGVIVLMVVSGNSICALYLRRRNKVA